MRRGRVVPVKKPIALPPRVLVDLNAYSYGRTEYTTSPGSNPKVCPCHHKKRRYLRRERRWKVSAGSAKAEFTRQPAQPRPRNRGVNLSQSELAVD